MLFYVRKPAPKAPQSLPVAAPAALPLASKAPGLEKGPITPQNGPAKEKSGVAKPEAAATPAAQMEKGPSAVPPKAVDPKLPGAKVSGSQAEAAPSSKTPLDLSTSQKGSGESAQVAVREGVVEAVARASESEDTGVPIARDGVQGGDAARGREEERRASGRGASSSAVEDEDYWDRYYSQHW
jgi:hypothetical protein